MPNELLPCPFCGASLERCDDSPIYGQSAMHPEADCMFSNNMLFHKDIMSMWNKRHGEDALRAELAKTQKALDKACKYNATYLHECPHEDCPQPKTVDCSACWKAYFMSLTPEQFGAEFKGENNG